MPSVSKKGEQTRQAILDAAVEIALREGLEGLTIGALADRLEMSKSGVFAHFGSRDELQIALIRDYARRFLDEVFFPAIREPRGLPRLKAMFDLWLSRCQRLEIASGCLFVSGAVEFDDREGPVRDVFVAIVHAWQQEMAKAARQAIDMGQLRADTDIEQLTFEIYGLMLVLHHDARLMRDSRAVPRAQTGFKRVIDAFSNEIISNQTSSSTAFAQEALASGAHPSNTPASNAVATIAPSPTPVSPRTNQAAPREPLAA
jgi:AcrR family transcriptional regulator